MNIFEKYKFKKVKNYVHDIIHRLTSISMELEDIKNFFHEEGFRYVGKRQLQIPHYIFNLLFILFYHPRYGFIVTVWANSRYTPRYTNRGISFASYDTPISKCRGIIKSVEENYKVHILNEMKEFFDIDDLKKYASRELFNVKLGDKKC